MRTLMCILTGLVAGACVAQPAADPATPSATPPPAPIDARPDQSKASERQSAFLIQIGAMDSAKASRAIRDAFEAGAKSKAPIVVLSIQATAPWRTDVVREILLDIKSCRTPVIVLLDVVREKPFANLGPVLVALAASQGASTESGFSVRVERDASARSLVAEKTDWTLLEADIRELMQPHLARRKLNDGLLDVLTWSAEDWWAVENIASKPPTWTLVKGARPANERGKRVFALCKAPRGGSDFEAFTLPASAMAMANNEAFLQADDLQALGRQTKIKLPTVRDAEIEESVDDAGIRAALIDDEVSLLRKRVDAALDAATGKDVRLSEARSQAQAQLPSLDRADDGIKALEALVTEYPELLRSPPPGQTSAGVRPPAMPARWRSMIQSHRNSVTSLRERARALAEAK
ncbi:MAG: hypothetical protein HEQ23_00335 [Tepidisphaera sp.]